MIAVVSKIFIETYFWIVLLSIYQSILPARFSVFFSFFCVYSIPLKPGNQHQCICMLKRIHRKRLTNILAKVNVYSRRCSADASRRTILCCIVTWTNTKKMEQSVLLLSPFPFFFFYFYRGRCLRLLVLIVLRRMSTLGGPTRPHMSLTLFVRFSIMIFWIFLIRKNFDYNSCQCLT